MICVSTFSNTKLANKIELRQGFRTFNKKKVGLTRLLRVKRRPDKSPFYILCFCIVIIAYRAVILSSVSPVKPAVAGVPDKRVQITL